LIEVAGEDVRTLVDVGFIALSAGMVDQAAVVFDGVVAARPDAEAGAIGRALVHLAKGDAEAAVGILRAAPPTDAVQSFLGLAYARWGMKAEAREALTSVLESPIASPHAELARMLLVDMDGA
jgi:predicted Zn-dependent protease